MAGPAPANEANEVNEANEAMHAPRCLVVQHHPAEGPGTLADHLHAHGVQLEACHTWAGDEPPPGTEGLDGLLVMGGPMSATGDDGFPTRRRELTLIEKALEAGVPTLGVCLGAQLLALASGGRVFPGRAGPEIGWGEVRLRPAAAGDALLEGTGPALRVLHWHGDTFETGPGSTVLASSERYPAQAFRAGDAAWGLQFHLEVDPPAAQAMAEAFAEEAALAPGGATEIVAGAHAAVTSPEPATILGRFAALVAGAPAQK